MYLYVLQLGENGPWACSIKMIERVIDHLGVVPFGVWLIEDDRGPSLYFGEKPTFCADPELLTSYTSIRAAVWGEYGEFGYEELYLTFGFYETETGEEEYQWTISLNNELIAMRREAKEGGLQEQTIRIKI